MSEQSRYEAEYERPGFAWTEGNWPMDEKQQQDITALNEQIARIKGWTRCIQPHLLQEICWNAPGPFLTIEDHKCLPDYTQPAMWAGLLVELIDLGAEPRFAKRQGSIYVIQMLNQGASDFSVGLAVCRAYIAAHLPAEAQAKEPNWVVADPRCDPAADRSEW